MPETTFTCALCQREFTNTWSEDEARAEAEELWGKQVMEHPTDVVCDSCFERARDWWEAKQN